MEVPVVGAVIDSIVGSSVENLISLLKEFRLITGIEKDVEKLVSVLSTIQDVLEDAEEQQINNKPISNWLRKLKDATYHAEDVLEAWALKIQDHNQMKAVATSSTNIVSRSLPSRLNPKNISFRRKIAKQIKEVISKFNEIADEQKFQLKTRSESQYSKQRRETTSVTTEPHIYGAEENVTNILDILVNTFANQDDVSVCPIVGMGGLGKTTLAQSVCNDERVQRHFELNIWVCVSEPFDVKLVLKAIVESFNKQACDLVTLEAVHRKVEEILRQKRYILVLDDVWNENQNEWNTLKSFLKGGAKGSSVVLTTRSSRVASITGTIGPYRLGALSDDNCFSLFKHHALGGRGEELHPNLAAIGKQIADKCKGVPLAAKSLGSLLRFKTEEKQWESVRDSEIWSSNETGENLIIEALRLSYNHLSSRLKQCFAYCAIFPKDFEMEKSKLIYLWMGNGFIQCEGKMELEKVGDDVFNELLRLSFFQEPQTDAFGNITRCKMHDLMHDLASYVAKNECVIAKVGETEDIPKTIRHLSVVCDDVADQRYLLSSPPSLRTFSFFHSHSIDLDRRFQFSSTLRVLDLSDRRIETLSPSICDLIHLRYLNLFGNNLVSLPESIHKLRNLLMLDLSFNRELRALPLSLCKLKCLRYLDLSWCKSITSLPEGLGSMSSLRHLDLSRCSSITSLPEGLGNMRSLRHLDLSHCSSVTSLPEGLGSMSSLRRLDLFWCKSITSLPEGLGSMSSLRHLNLSHCSSITSLPEGLGSMSSLRHLDLSWCESITSLPEGLGSMGSLRHLDLSGCSSITSLPEGLGSMSSLRHLDLSWCESITSLPEGLGSMSSLRHLDLSRCSTITSLPEGLGSMISLIHLDLFCCYSITSLPEGLGSMSSLIHLDLSCCYSITSLPEGLGSMSSLIHLDLSSCSSITSLPEGLGCMSSLRHLHNWGCDDLHKMPVGMGKLTCLETLDQFVVGKWPSDGDNGGGGASISELQGLNQLRGWLTIRGLENVRNGEDAKEANLSSKTHLSGLELRWKPREDVNNSKEVLEGLLWLPLNNNITRLEIWDYKAAYFPEVFLQNLKSLKLLDIMGCDELVSLPEGILQKLISLEKLKINYCERLKSLGCTWTQGDSNLNTSSSASSSSHFQELSIEWCPVLQFSDEDFQNLDALRELTLRDLPQLTALPQGIQHLPMLRRLKIYRCENLRIFPAWVNRREKEKGEDWDFYCTSTNIEFGPEEVASEPATEETTKQVEPATEAIFDNPNIETAPNNART